MHYCAAWTDSGFFFTCDDRHGRIGEAIVCIPCAGGYVVAIERGVMRALTLGEEAQFQSIVHNDLPLVSHINNPFSESVRPQVPGETLLELVRRITCAYGFGSEKDSEVTPDSIRSAVMRFIDEHECSPDV